MVFNSGEWHAVDAPKWEGLGCPARVWCPQAHLEEAMGVLLEEMYSEPKKFGLVHIKKPLSTIHVLRLPEEVEVEEELIYSQKRYVGEEWAPSTHHVVSELWDEHEMSDDMDTFEKECEQKENLIRLQAKSPLPSGAYFVPDKNFLETAIGLIEEIYYKELNHKDTGYVYEGPTWEEATMERAKTREEGGYPWFSDVIYYKGDRAPILPPGVITDIIDDQDRVNTIVKIKQKGHKFCLAESSYGDVYVDLKFTAYIPDVGENAFMVIKKKALGKNAPFVCKRIV